MGVLEHFEPTLYFPLCMTSVMTLSVSLEMAYIILTDPRLAPPLGVGRGGAGLATEPWGPPRPMAGPVLALGAWRILHLTFLAFILGNVVGNLCLFIRRNPSIRGVFLSGRALGQGWGYCYMCESHTPQRCSHCYDCKVCVLRRDHHCVFFSQCVGHANHRYFLCCIAHMWLGLLYAIVLNTEIFMELLQEGLSLHSVFLLIMPWAMLITDMDWAPELKPPCVPVDPQQTSLHLRLGKDSLHPVGTVNNQPASVPARIPKCLLLWITLAESFPIL